MNVNFVMIYPIMTMALCCCYIFIEYSHTLNFLRSQSHNIGEKVVNNSVDI
jgi:hypothetical protein